MNDEHREPDWRVERGSDSNMSLRAKILLYADRVREDRFGEHAEVVKRGGEPRGAP